MTMELHRLDGYTVSGIDNLDIQDIDFETLEERDLNGQQVEALENLGYVREPTIAYEILDEAGNVVMYADEEENLYVMDGLGELGFFKKIGKGLRNASRFVRKKVVRPVSRGVKNAARFTTKKVVKPVVKTFNRFLNPATILLRNGFLLAMKINLMKVAERLRFGYLDDAEARRRGVNMREFAKLKKAVEKANKIYELAGGKKSNLKKAILTGKGNKDRAVALNGPGLGNPIDLDPTDEFTDPFERLVVESDPDEIEALLNASISIEGLGEVATGSAIAAASGAVATVSALLNKITGVFDKAKKVKGDVTNVVNQAKSLVPDSSRSRLPSTPVVRELPAPFPRSLSRFNSQQPATNVPTTNSPSNDTGANVRRTPEVQAKAPVDPPASDENFFQKHKTALLIGAGVIVAGGGVYYAVRQSNKKEKPIDGIPRDAKGRFLSQGKSKSRKKPVRKKKDKLVPTALL